MEWTGLKVNILGLRSIRKITKNGVGKYNYLHSEGKKLSIVFLTHVYIYSPAHGTYDNKKPWLYWMVFFDGCNRWFYLPSWLGQEDLSWRHRSLLLSPETSSADPWRFCNHSINVLLSFWARKILFDILLSVNLDLTFGKLSFSEPCIASMDWFQIAYKILSQQMRFLIAQYYIESEKVSLMILFFSIIFFPHSSANKFLVISEVTRWGGTIILEGIIIDMSKLFSNGLLIHTWYTVINQNLRIGTVWTHYEH